MNDYTLTEDTAKRFLRMLAWVERQQAQGEGGQVGRDTEVPNWQLVRVDTDVSAISPAATFQRGHVVHFDASTGVLDELGEVFVADSNSRELLSGDIVLASQSGKRSSGDDDLPVFVVSMPCCAGVPGTCCDMEVVGSLCLTFTEITIDGLPANGGGPVVITLDVYYDFFGVGYYNGTPFAITNGTTSANTVFSVLCFQLPDDVITLIGCTIDGVIVDSPTGTVVVACDPYYALTETGFTATVGGHTYEFVGPITATQGACPS